MKRTMLALLCLALVVSGCAERPQLPSPTVAPIETPTETVAPVAEPPAPTEFGGDALAAFGEVCRNERRFFAVMHKETLETYLDDLYLSADSDMLWEIGAFAVVDMDGDDVPEVILEEARFGDRLVLYFDDGAVYGYDAPYRGMIALKTDGTFNFSSGAADNGFARLEFYGGIAEAQVFAESNSEYVDSELEVAYYIERRAVMESEFFEFTEAWFARDDAEWFEFTGENIALRLA
ncbi:MAG: hypothetical protein LBN30_02940 [Oscillospiraceae bacterium]|jgi:hypothetical protein|nr:hypothetical protein [Oscillospiraceae bacterium]